MLERNFSLKLKFSLLLLYFFFGIQPSGLTQWHPFNRKETCILLILGSKKSGILESRMRNGEPTELPGLDGSCWVDVLFLDVEQ